MVARPEEVVQNLYSNDAATRLKAIREVKNQIIGNKTKKLSYVKLGVVPRVVELLASEGEHDDAAIKVQSATAVGSFAYGVPDGLRAVVDSGGVASLLQALHSEQEKVVEASVRSLKMIYQACRGCHVCATMRVLLSSSSSQPITVKCATTRQHCHA